ncbi:MAG: NAD-dependent dihydropyrimidine dehydrogenase subunit PreA, partial [Planctomycetota bacterium]|nr:NAD-dependent dihydropyrimidine dehydrogenase subunit PreA [Planctomycetota bacterium]
MPDLTVESHGIRFPNPFLIASGPPGTNARVIGRALDEGWGGVVAKTVCLDAERIVNVAPRYARMRAESS